MKICFFSGDITNPGGTEKASTALANLIASECDGEYEICFLSITEKRSEMHFELDGRIKRYTLRKNPVKSYAAYLPMIFTLARFIKREKIDVIIDIDSVLDIVSVGARLFSHVRVISWAHFNFDEELGTLYRRYIKKITVKHADALVVLTDSDRQKYLDRCSPKCPVITIRNPLSKPVSVAPYSERENLIISVGGLVPVKGFDMIPDIAEKLFAACPDWKWIIAGEGDEEDNLRALIDKRGLADKLILAGYVDDIASLYDKSAVYALTSRTEGLPMVLLEARLHALPVVSFDIGACVTELTRGGCAETVLPFDTDAMADCLKRLTDDRDKRQKMSVAALALDSEFSPEHIFDLWNRLLQD